MAGRAEFGECGRCSLPLCPQCGIHSPLYGICFTLSSTKSTFFLETMEKRTSKRCPALPSHPLLLNISPFALNTDLSNSTSCFFDEQSPKNSFYYLGQFPQAFIPSCTLAFLTQYPFSEFPTFHFPSSPAQTILSF